MQTETWMLPQLVESFPLQCSLGGDGSVRNRAGDCGKEEGTNIVSRGKWKKKRSSFWNLWEWKQRCEKQLRIPVVTQFWPNWWGKGKERVDNSSKHYKSETTLPPHTLCWQAMTNLRQPTGNRSLLLRISSQTSQSSHCWWLQECGAPKTVNCKCPLLMLLCSCSMLKEPPSQASSTLTRGELTQIQTY